MMLASTRQVRALCLGLVVLLCCAVTALCGSKALAANMSHHDLSSLAYASDAVVRARAVAGLRDVDEQEFVVVHSYRGNLKPGQRFKARMFAVSFASTWGGPPVKPADDVVMFLEHNENHGWLVLGSGLRMFVDDKAYRFVQLNNPGPYEPVGQGLDPYDIYDDPRGKQVLSRKEFLQLLPQPVTRANQFVDALSAADSPAAREHLLTFMGPALGDDNDTPVTKTDSYGFEDLIAMRVLEELHNRGDMPRFLEALSRQRGGVIYWHLRLNVSAQKMVEAAADHTRPLHHRLAALTYLREEAFASRKVYPELIALLADQNPAIRAAAIAAGPRDKNFPAWRDALVKFAAVEQHPAVRFELIAAARYGRFIKQLQLPEDTLAVRARRRGRRIELAWAGEAWGGLLVGLRLEAANGSTTQTLVFDIEDRSQVRTWQSMGVRGLYAYAFFDPPLANTPHDLTLIADFNKDRQLRLPLRGLGKGHKVPPGSSPSKPPELETETEPEPEVVPVPGSVDAPEPVVAPAGCRCQQRGIGDWPWVPLLGVFAVTWFLRPRSRGRTIGF